MITIKDVIVIVCGGIFSVIIYHVTLSKELEQESQANMLDDKAIYIPGSVCIIKATENESPKDMLYFADACVASHREWLNKEN